MIVGNRYGDTLGDPGEVGSFAGAAIQIVGLAIALPAGIVAAKLRFPPRRRRRPAAWSAMNGLGDLVIETGAVIRAILAAENGNRARGGRWAGCQSRLPYCPSPPASWS